MVVVVAIEVNCDAHRTKQQTGCLMHQPTDLLLQLWWQTVLQKQQVLLRPMRVMAATPAVSSWLHNGKCNVWYFTVKTPIYKTSSNVPIIKIESSHCRNCEIYHLWLSGTSLHFNQPSVPLIYLPMNIVHHDRRISIKHPTLPTKVPLTNVSNSWCVKEFTDLFSEYISMLWRLDGRLSEMIWSLLDLFYNDKSEWRWKGQTNQINAWNKNQ
jgi:hypothetical protein